jgi:hypothetical protein
MIDNDGSAWDTITSKGTPANMTTITKYGPFTVDEFVTEADTKMVEFDPKDLDAAFASNPGTIAYFGNLLGRAKRQSANFKTKRDATKSLVSRKIREAAIADGKKPSEAFIEIEMRSDESFVKVSNAEAHAIQVEQCVEALYWAARGRRGDMEFFAQNQRAELGARAYSSS